MKESKSELDQIASEMFDYVLNAGECETLHHKRNEHHNYDKPCPAKKRLTDLQNRYMRYIDKKNGL